MSEFTDRYQALGIPYPDAKKMCTGACEGTGWIPIPRDCDEQRYARLWQIAEDKEPTDDGYHFVKCPDCGGTGKSQGIG